MDHLQTPEIGMIREASHDPFFQLPSQATQMQVLIKNRPKHVGGPPAGVFEEFSSLRSRI